MTNERAGITGTVTVERINAAGEVVERCVTHNLITQVGDQYYADRAAGIAGAPAQVTGMKLGTGSTAPAKTGAGAALVTYLTNSHQGIDASYPTSALNGSSRRITWRATWAAGKATTASPITEVAMVNETLADATSAAAATISRALVTGISAKGAGDTVIITWTHDLLGA